MKTAVESLIDEFNEELQVAIAIGNGDKIRTIKHLLNITCGYLEMEKEQREQDFINGYKARAELSGLIFDEASELTAKELFKQQEQ